ncbi:alanine racemase [Tsukamurella sp. 8F]|uniref:alanine racemase n=1 Tax=unclassified Tsukamurella TaxID=2633480 RepID=UPI0023B950C6|nr:MULTISPECIES: alanine racemase [unclassified Tsukamurella]MDF0531766.1 alanine racemase [Tsukamurella sp. 8J]MDF0588032.1 alanine racemase [Tsukamurella sp. 8F]
MTTAAQGRALTVDRLTAHVDLDAVAHNVRILAARAGGTPVMAVVKSDGYGHGAPQIARAALAAGAAEIGVTTVDEALALRAAGITAPILSWLSTSGFGPAIEAGVRLGVSSPRQLATVAADARAVGVTAEIDVKVDTGLSRNGVAPAEWDAMLDALVRSEADGTVHVHGVFTHLAHGDEPGHPFLDVQRDRLTAAVAQARGAGLSPTVVHAANSGATLTRPDLRFDMVRPGIALYGRSPIEGDDFGLRPVMTLAAPVILTKRLTAGDGVSYGHEWIAPRDTVVGLIPAGYADGVVRSLGNRLEVAIDGRRFRGVGRICMDQFVVDLGPDGGGVSEGDTAVLFGGVREGEPTAKDWADLVGTIDYEILTGVHGRVVRRYAGGGAS